MPPVRQAAPRPEGLRISEVCQEQRISRATAWRWVEKGLLQVTRAAPRTGVRVRYSPRHFSRAEDPEDDD